MGAENVNYNLNFFYIFIFNFSIFGKKFSDKNKIFGQFNVAVIIIHCLLI